jgi:ABC-2 type transport system permease protein
MNRRRLSAQAGFELRLLARNGENLLVTLVIPLAVLVFFSVVDVLPTEGMAPVDVLAPGAITLAVMGSAMVSLGISTGFERDQGVLKRLGVTPLRRVELVTAKALAVLAVQVAQITLLVLTAVALGWRPEVTPAGGAAATAGLLLASAAFAGIGLTIAGRLPALRALASINALFLVFLMLAGVIVPLTALPPPLEALALALPPAWLTGLLHGTLGDSGPPVMAALGALAAWAAVAGTVAARSFRWD